MVISLWEIRGKHANTYRRRKCWLYHPTIQRESTSHMWYPIIFSVFIPYYYIYISCILCIIILNLVQLIGMSVWDRSIILTYIEGVPTDERKYLYTLYVTYEHVDVGIDK